MDLSSSPRSSLEWSLDDSSTCPTTPASSPLFRAAKVDDVPSSHCTSPTGISGTRGAHDAASANSTCILADDRVKSVCVVGAGYVGRLQLALPSFTSQTKPALQADQPRLFSPCTTPLSQ